MAAGLAAPHAEQDVLGTKSAVHADGVVSLGDVFGEIRVERARGDAAGRVPIDPLDELRVGVEGRLDLPGALEIGQGSPRVFVEPRLTARAIPAGASEVSRVLRGQHDDR